MACTHCSHSLSVVALFQSAKSSLLQVPCLDPSNVLAVCIADPVPENPYLTCGVISNRALCVCTVYWIVSSCKVTIVAAVWLS